MVSVSIESQKKLAQTIYDIIDKAFAEEIPTEQLPEIIDGMYICWSCNGDKAGFVKLGDITLPEILELLAHTIRGYTGETKNEHTDE